MSNPLGGSGAGSPEDRNEFIELYNRSKDTINLSRFKITDFDSEDDLIPFHELNSDSTMQLPPHEYAIIIDPEYIDSGENFMPYGIPDCIILRPENTTIGNGLTNNDSIALLDSLLDTLSTYYHPFNAGNGISVERISPSTGDIESNWCASQDSTGSTPGFRNSVFSLPDFSIDTISVDCEYITIYLENNNDTTLSGDIYVFNDVNRNRNRESGEIIYSCYLDNITGDSIITINFYLPEEDVYLIGIELINKTLFRRVRVKNGISNLVINEVMYAPEESSEWIELYNHSNFDFSIDSLFFDDEVMPVSMVISKDEYIVFSDDSSKFFAYYGNIPAKLFSIDLSLSNNGDSILIYDGNKFLIDKIKYNGNEVESNYTLERVSSEIGWNIASNWGQSIEEGGSPGLTNSIHAEYKPENIDLKVIPKHFTPDGDGVDESCIISFSLPYLRNDVKLRIYDRRGHLLKENSGIYGGDRGEWVWNGKNRKNTVLPTDIYIVFLSIKDMDSNNTSVQKTVVSIGR